MCVCVLSSHPFWTSSSLDVPAGVTQEEGHTGFFNHLPSAVHALIFLAKMIQPFLSLVDREVEILCMGSKLRCQRFDLVKFREIIPRNPCYGTFFSRNFESECSKSFDPPAEPKLESELWPNSDPSSWLDNFVRTSPRGSCAAF